IELLGEAAAIRKAAFGPKDALVGRTLANRGIVLWRAQRLDEAEAALAEAAELMHAGMGDHPDVAYVMSTLASLRAERKDLPGAEVALREVLRIRRAALGDADPTTAQVSIDLGLCLRKQGKSAAEWHALLRGGLAVLEPKAAPDDGWVKAA